MDEDYGYFRLIKGNIAEFEDRGKKAIVVPCFSDFTAACRISDSVSSKMIEKTGSDDFFKKIVRDKKGKGAKLFSAYYFPFREQWIDGIILSACYVDTKSDTERQLNKNYYIKAAKSTRKALGIARKNSIDSIAFPVLMAGKFGGSVDSIALGMMDKIIKHGNGMDISIYAFEEKIFKEFLETADTKLR